MVKTITHGTNYGYKTGCRCAPCKAAKAIYGREYHLRKVGQKRSEEEAVEGRPNPELEQWRSLSVEEVADVCDLSVAYAKNLSLPDALQLAIFEIESRRQ